MILSIDQHKHVLRAGGGFVLDSTNYTFVQLKDMAAAAKTGNATMTVKNVSGFTADQLAELAALAPGLIVFDLATDAGRS
jgi:hypothetical protein